MAVLSSNEVNDFDTTVVVATYPKRLPRYDNIQVPIKLDGVRNTAKGEKLRPRFRTTTDHQLKQVTGWGMIYSCSDVTLARSCLQECGNLESCTLFLLGEGT